jgi:hypothetical protein
MPVAQTNLLGVRSSYACVLKNVAVVSIAERPACSWSSLAVGELLHRLSTIMLHVVIVKDFGVPAEIFQSATMFTLLPMCTSDKVHNATLSLVLGFLVLFVNLLVHHYLPGIHWKVCIIERPVKLLVCYGLIRWVGDQLLITSQLLEKGCATEKRT